MVAAAARASHRSDGFNVIRSSGFFKKNKNKIKKREGLKLKAFRVLRPWMLIYCVFLWDISD